MSGSATPSSPPTAASAERSQAHTNLPTTFKTVLAHDSNNAYLDLILNFGMPSGLNRNQQVVATALTDFFNSSIGIPLAFGAFCRRD